MAKPTMKRQQELREAYLQHLLGTQIGHNAARAQTEAFDDLGYFAMDEAKPDEAALWTEAARDRLLLAARRDAAHVRLDVAELIVAMHRQEIFMADTFRTLRAISIVVAITLGFAVVRPLLGW